jgi:protocatechuate 3,4-dioxygenase beta subunit
MRGLVTRAYFDGETLNATDPLLHSIDDPMAATLIAAGGEGRGGWMRLQGDGETVPWM